ncbi:MAG: dTDP-glucose 4,6-dehydratase [Gemmatimonadetes bacterium]|nr:dTDP-glucose 4,6-dehydratase [Gemmatimonadota bacterium]
MRILVTGGAGFIGSNFVHHVMKQHPGIEVVVLDKLTYAGNLENLAPVADDPGYSFIKGDICDPVKVREAMEGCDVVLNFAAESHVDRSIENPGAFVQTDVYGAYVLLEAAKEFKVGRFIQISTDEVYGERMESPATEESTLMPRNPYAASKAGGDRLAFSYWATYDMPVVITRCTNNYGPYQYPEKLIPLFTTNAIDDEPLPVYGSGKNIRDWIHVLDHAEALRLVMNAEGGVDGEVFNVAAENALDVLTITDRILEALGKPKDLIQHVTDRQGHDRRYWLLAGKAKERLGWELKYTTFEQGIEETVKWYAENEDWWRKIKSGEFMEYYKKQYAEISK